MALEDLESASQKLMADGKDNVFSKLDSAWNDVANGKGTVDGLSKAVNDVVSAVKNFADEYNYTVSYLYLTSWSHFRGEFLMRRL